MVSITVTLDDELKSRVDKLSWINWSDVVRREALRKLEDEEKLQKLKKILSKSRFTEQDADELAEKVKASMHKELVKKGLI